MKVHVETKRLILREFVQDDVDDIYELDSDPEVHKYLGMNPISNLAQCEKVIDFVRNQYEERGIGRWAVIEKESGDFLGWTGLKLEIDDIDGYSNYYDLGFRFKRKHWGKGYATESAIASLNYGFDRLALEKINAAAHIENGASNHVIRKLGFTRTDTIEYDGQTHNWYELSKADWERIKPTLSI